tara:strand:+ start:441 stop:1400 length:960 start_codon:yes stop_codon:yes gene_type:complete
MSVNYHLRRRNKSFLRRKVSEALPEYYGGEFPTLINFLEEFYNYVDSDGTHGFSDNINRSFATRDIHETENLLLNSYVSELAANLRTGENFSDVRYALTRLAEFLRVKGSKLSIQEFFKLFFQQSVEVEYPKNNIFNVGDSASQIGVESLRFLQNNARFQTFSLLIKIGISSGSWNELYKKFVHPAGFYYEAEILIGDEATNAPTAPLVVLDSSVGPTIVSEASAPFSLPFVQTTVLIDSGGGDVRSSLAEIISDYQNIPLSQLDTTYHTVKQIITPNSFTFDDSSIRDSDENATPDFSMTLETMDNEIFTRRVTDSSF